MESALTLQSSFTPGANYRKPFLIAYITRPILLYLLIPTFCLLAHSKLWTVLPRLAEPPLEYLCLLLSPSLLFILTNVIIGTLLIRALSPRSSDVSSSLSNIKSSGFLAERFGYDSTDHITGYSEHSTADFVLNGPSHPDYLLGWDVYGRSKLIPPLINHGHTCVHSVDTERREMYEDHDLLIMQSPLGCELLGQQPIKSSLDISSLSSTMAVESHIIDSSIRISQENLAEQKEPAGSPTFYREDQQINSMNIQSSPSCERLCRTGVSQASSHQRPPSRSCKKTHTESIASETAEGQHSLRRPPSSPRLQQSSKIGNAVSIEDGSSGKANRHSSGSSKPRDLQVSQSVKHQQNIPCSESMNSAVTISCHAGLEGSTRTTNSEHVSGSSVDNASSHTRKNHRKNSKKTDIDLTLPPPLVTSHTNMQRTQSLNNISTPEEDRPVCSTVHEVKRSPSLSESLDMLSNDEANKIFSDFIAHRLSVMKKETCINSYAMPRKV